MRNFWFFAAIVVGLYVLVFSIKDNNEPDLTGWREEYQEIRESADRQILDYLKTKQALERMD